MFKVIVSLCFLLAIANGARLEHIITPKDAAKNSINLIEPSNESTLSDDQLEFDSADTVQEIEATNTTLPIVRTPLQQFQQTFTGQTNRLSLFFQRSHIVQSPHIQSNFLQHLIYFDTNSFIQLELVYTGGVYSLQILIRNTYLWQYNATSNCDDDFKCRITTFSSGFNGTFCIKELRFNSSFLLRGRFELSN